MPILNLVKAPCPNIYEKECTFVFMGSLDCFEERVVELAGIYFT